METLVTAWPAWGPRYVDDDAQGGGEEGFEIEVDPCLAPHRKARGAWRRGKGDLHLVAEGVRVYRWKPSWMRLLRMLRL